jgi:hypothetical protein
VSLFADVAYVNSVMMWICYVKRMTCIKFHLYSYNSYIELLEHQQLLSNQNRVLGDHRTGCSLEQIMRASYGYIWALHESAGGHMEWFFKNQRNIRPHAHHLSANEET